MVVWEQIRLRDLETLNVDIEGGYRQKICEQDEAEN